MNSPEEPKIADITRKAEAAKAQLQQLSATLTSKDGAATVTVNVSGALQQLSFGARAHEMPLNQLAASVLSTAQRAQAQAAKQMTAVMAPLIGQNSDAMKFLEEQLPAPEVPDEEPLRSRATPSRPSRPPAEDDGDDFGSILQRGW